MRNSIVPSASGHCAPCPVLGFMTPLQRYHRDLEEGVLFPDPAQAHAIDCVQQLYDALVREKPSIGPWERLRQKLGLSEPDMKPDICGIYFYGGVGRGKTYIMDILYESLPFERKLRTHFHRFMQRVHQELNRLNQQSDPLEVVAGILAREARIICFDEFFVSDIGDAMILGGLAVFVWYLVQVWRGRRSRWAKVWSVLLVLAGIVVVWVGFAFHLLDFGTNY